MRAKFARGTPWWVAVPPVLTVLAAWGGLQGLGAPAFALALLFLVLAVLTVNFYRDPDRNPGKGIVSPADGTVSGVDIIDGRTRIMIFMSPLDVHVNRAPCGARIVSRTHVPGSYLPAFRKDSERNERMVWDLETEFGSVRMVQIAGTVARRIVPYASPGGILSKGERFGMIRFGSRVDLYLPAGLAILVARGQRVRAGETTVARPPMPLSSEAPIATRSASRPASADAPDPARRPVAGSSGGAGPSNAAGAEAGGFR